MSAITTRAHHMTTICARWARSSARPEILDDLDVLNLYHPSVFLAHRTVEQADDEVSGETASDLIQRTRRVLRWARPMVLG